MARNDTLGFKAGEKAFILGNQAIARGAFEAGLKVAAAYPGTPSSEILETLAMSPLTANMHVEWSVNEKSTLEVAIGAAYSGVRSFAAMKHVGVNVALDALVTLAYTGVKGGLVLVSADDPSAHSSQNEQDNRLLARFAKIFCLEPHDPQSAKDYTKLAFDISEEFEIPVMLRSTTRVSHARGGVKFGKVSKRQKEARFIKDAKRFVCIPSHARPLHVALNKKLKKMEEFSNTSQLNNVSFNGKSGIITSGISRAYVKEALSSLGIEKEVSLLEIGITHPLPGKLIQNFLKKVEKVLVVEELEPYVEDFVRKTDSHKEIEGKSLVPRELELNVDIVKKAVSKFMGLKYEGKEVKTDIKLPDRPPILCPGCSHRAVFYALKKIAKEKIYPGDIGCYTLGVMEPIETVDTCLCMGAGISQGAGMVHAGVGDSVVAIIGDSTFLHAGMTGLMNAVYNKAKMTVLILDNRTTAMTGLQPHPGVGLTARGEKTTTVDFVEVAKACGAEFVKKIKPFELDESIATLKEALNYDGVSVVIAEEPCALLAKKMKMWKKPLKVDTEKCAGWECQDWFPDKVFCSTYYWGVCQNLIACPAMSWEEGKAKIMEEFCSGCALCAKLCPNEAIVEQEEKNED